MINVSDTWKAGMNENTHYTTTAEVTLADDTELTLTADEICVKTNRFTDGAGKTSFPIGEAMSRTMQIEVNNHDGSYSEYDFEGAVIWLYLNYDEESITIGKFTVLSPATYGDTIIITGQDDMYLADKPFETALTYPTTAGAMWAEICASCGITNGMTTIPQGSFVINTAPSGGLTYRALLGYIAMLSGGNARVNRAAELEIVNYDMTSLNSARQGGGSGVTITDDGNGNITISGATVSANGGDITVLTGGIFSDDGSGNITWSVGGSWDIHNLNMWRTLKVDANDIEITGIQTTVLDASGNRETILSGTDDYAIALSSPLWRGRETTALATILTAVGGVPFRPFSGEYIAYPLAEFADIARIVDRNGNQFYTIITDVGFTWASSTVLKCEAKAPTKNATDTAAKASEDMERVRNILEATGINADWINTGKLTVKDGDENILLLADTGNNYLRISNWEVYENEMRPVQEPGQAPLDTLFKASSIQAHTICAWENINQKTVFFHEGRELCFADGVSFNGDVINLTKTYGRMDGLSVPRVIWEYGYPQMTQPDLSATSISDPSDPEAPVKSINHFNMFYVEIEWSKDYPQNRNGVWVYAPDGEETVVQPTGDYYSGTTAYHAFRKVTFDKTGSTHTMARSGGYLVTGSSVSANNDYAIVTRIIAMKV